MFGNPETTTGGKALKFYSSVRIDIRRIGAVKDGDTVVGSRTKVKIVKNKVAAPFRDAEFDILYGEGISREGDVLDLAVLHNIVDKSGAWYSYQGERIGQGRENVRGFLKENKDVFARVDAELTQEAWHRWCSRRCSSGSGEWRDSSQGCCEGQKVGFLCRFTRGCRGWGHGSRGLRRCVLVCRRLDFPIRRSYRCRACHGCCARGSGAWSIGRR